MAAGNWQRIQEVFDAALLRPAEERGAFLDHACAGDGALRAEIDALLKFDEEAPPDFMPSDCAGTRSKHEGHDGALDPITGAQIGRYRIAKLLGAGGMGAVYLAEQENPTRPVAIKVMRTWASSPSVLRRLEFEGRVLARLHHPHVAQVYETGTHSLVSPGGEQTVPYFVMEYVRNAKPITEFARTHRLSTRQRVELFLQVCDAVEHGHQKGIIHRDLKPGNILVDGEGSVKVIDFGVARSTDSDMTLTSIRTDAGDLVGTLQYMSPEQCAADPANVDTRSDVYALGVVLYELLCGRPPYELAGSSIYEAVRVICEQSASPMNVIDRKLRGDLETIARCALDKDRTRRYQSAAALGADLRRYLNREPISARPPTTWARSIRFAARHPIIVTGGLSVCVALCTLIATYAVVEFQYGRPHQIEVSKDLRTATLTSRGRNILHEWLVDPPGEITAALLLDQDRALGGKRIAILGYGNAEGEEYSNSLCAFDLTHKRYDEPCWYSRFEESDLPIQLRDEPDCEVNAFRVRTAVLADVFPDCPGEEIIVVHAHFRWSPQAIRIYASNGDVLFQAWHYGAVKTPFWWAEESLLVLPGLDGGTRWADLGIPDAKNRCPTVLFALRPVRRERNSSFINGKDSRSQSTVAWYRYLLPPPTRRAIHPAGVGRAPDQSEGEGVELLVGISAAEGAPKVGLTVDKSGEVVAGSQFANDDYADDQSLPNVQTFRLVDRSSIEEFAVSESAALRNATAND